MRRSVVLALLFAFVSTVSWATSLDDIVNSLKEKQAKVKAALKSIKIVSETTTELGGAKIVMRGIVYQKGNKIRSENEPIQTPPDIPKEYLQKTITIFDGKDLWIISPAGTQRIPMEFGEIEKMKPIDDLGWLTDYVGDMKLEGEEVVDGRPCYVISLSKPVKMVLYLDKDSLEWVKSEQEVNGDKLVVKREDFKDVPGISGFKVPYRVEIYMNGEKIAETVVKSVDVNPEISDTLFVVKMSVPASPEEDKPAKTEGWGKLEELAK